MLEKRYPAYMIGVVAELLEVHPQTLRIYEREGLVVPTRSKGNTRLYSQEDVEQLRLVIRLTRGLGINLAGVEIILEMRRRLNHMQDDKGEFIDQVILEMRSMSSKASNRVLGKHPKPPQRIIPISKEDKT